MSSTVFPPAHGVLAWMETPSSPPHGGRAWREEDLEFKRQTPRWRKAVDVPARLFIKLPEPTRKEPR